MRRFAWMYGVGGVLALLVAGSLGFVYKEMAPSVWGALGAAAALFTAWGTLEREGLVALLASRGFRYGTGSITLTGMVGAVALFGFVLAKDHDHRWDLTRDARFTLAEGSVSTVAGLKEPVEILAFFQTGTQEERRFRDLTDMLKEASPLLSVRFVDPFRDAALAQQFAITTAYGTVVIKQGEKSQRLESDFSETAVMDALVRIQSATTHRVCWVSGHGEYDLTDEFGPDGYGLLAAKLKDLNYAAVPFTLLMEDPLERCDVLTLVGTRSDLSPLEEEKLAVFLAAGRRALIALEPGDAEKFSASLARYGVIVGDDLVLNADPAARAAGLDDPTVILLGAAHRSPHALTDPLRGDLLFQLSRSVTALEGSPGMAGVELLRTGEAAWAETAWRDAAAADAVGPDAGVDVVGQVPLMVAAEVIDASALQVGAPRETDAAPAEAEGRALPEALSGLSAAVDLNQRAAAVPEGFAPQSGGRLAVLGDASFAANRFLAVGSNQDLFLNALAWLVKEDAQLLDRPNDSEGQTLEMNVLEEALVWLVTIFLVPLTAVAGAILMALRRRFQ